jgi:predicted nicotinamide N-methyase
MLIAEPAYETKHLSPLIIELRGETEDVKLLICQSQAEGETGSTLWLSAQVLAAYLLDRVSLPKGCSILELGSGTGFLAVVLSIQGHRVFATDTADLIATGNLQQTLAWNQDAIARSAGSVTVQAVDWYDADVDLPTADCIPATDVIYHPLHIPALVRIIKQCAETKPTPVIYIAQEVRTVELMQDFHKHVTRAGFSLSIVKPDKIAASVSRQLQWAAEVIHVLDVQICKLRLRKAYTTRA